MSASSKLNILIKLIRTVRNWPTVVLNRLGVLHQDLIVHKLRNGLIIASRSFSVDRSALQDVWLEESYEPSRSGIPWDWTDCRTIVDIGGNIGTFTLYALLKAPRAVVHVVEPEPGNNAMLRSNLAQNGFLSRVHIHASAIGSERGSAVLHISCNSGGHSLFHHKHLTSRSVTVPALTLADLFQEQGIVTCDFLKLDCEGAEYEALYGLSSVVLANIRAIAVECP